MIYIIYYILYCMRFANPAEATGGSVGQRLGALRICKGCPGGSLDMHTYAYLYHIYAYIYMHIYIYAYIFLCIHVCALEP